MDLNISHKITDGMRRRGERLQPARVNKSQEATATDNERGVMMGGSGATQGDNKGGGAADKEKSTMQESNRINNEGREGQNDATWGADDNDNGDCRPPSTRNPHIHHCCRP